MSWWTVRLPMQPLLDPLVQCAAVTSDYLISKWAVRRPASSLPTCTVYSVLSDPGLLNYLMPRWTVRRPASPWPTFTVYSVTSDYLISNWTVRRPPSPWPTCTVYSVTPDYWTTWCPDELHVAQPPLDPPVQCTLWPRITELPDVQKNWTPPSLCLTHSYSARVSKETRSMHLFLQSGKTCACSSKRFCLVWTKPRINLRLKDLSSFASTVFLSSQKTRLKK